MEMTQVSGWIGKRYDGYTVTTELSDENAAVVVSFLTDMQQQFGDALYCMPRENMHISLLEWIEPKNDYHGQDKHQLFEQKRENYDKALTLATAANQPFTVTFDRLHVFPNSVVMLGSDDGQFAAMRQAFNSGADVLPETKASPEIIHSTLIRFRQQISLDAVREAVARHTVDLRQPIDNFRLTYTMIEPMMEYQVLKRYRLGQGTSPLQSSPARPHQDQP